MRAIVKLPDFKVLLGAAVSNVLNCDETFSDAELLTIISKASVIDAVTYTFEISTDNGTTYGTLTNEYLNASTAKYVPAAAGLSTIITKIGFTNIRIKMSVNATQDHVWSVAKQIGGGLSN